MYKSLFVSIPLTTSRINFRISECHHRFSMTLIIIFLAKNGKLFLDHTDPLIVHENSSILSPHPEKIGRTRFYD